MTQRKLAALIITPIVGGILSIGFVLQHPVLGLLVFMAGIGAGGYLCYRIWRHYNRFGSTYDPQLKATLAQLQSIDARIADNYRIVNS